MEKFIDLDNSRQKEIYKLVCGLLANGFGYKRVIKEIARQENVKIAKSTLWYWCKENVKLISGQNYFEEKPSPELAYVLGVMFGDGNIYCHKKKQDYIVRLDATDKDFVEKFSICASSVLGRKRNYAVIPSKRRSMKSVMFSCRARSKQLYFFIKSIKSDFEKAKPFIEAHPAEFIQGLADSEGCPAISASKVFTIGVSVANSANLQLLEYCKYLLESFFGIKAKVRLTKKAGMTDSVINGRIITRTMNVYLLEINTLELTKKYFLHIGFSIRRKQEKLADGINIFENFSSRERILEWKKLYSKKGRQWKKILT